MMFDKWYKRLWLPALLIIIMLVVQHFFHAGVIGYELAFTLALLCVFGIGYSFTYVVYGKDK